MLNIIFFFLSCSSEQQTNRAEQALARHDLAQAESLFREAVQKKPQNIKALVGLGWTYQLAGERSAAQKVFNRCLRVEPKNPDCLRGRSSVAMSMSEITKARELIEEAYAAHPDHPGVLSSLALFRMHEGNVHKAKEIYESLIRRFPNKAEYHLGLGEAELRLRNPQETVAITQKALEMRETPLRYQAMLWVLRTRALISASAGRENPEDCKGTAPQVEAWIQQAKTAMKEAEKSGIELPEFPVLKRQVLRRNAIFEEKCPRRLWEKNDKDNTSP